MYAEYPYHVPHAEVVNCKFQNDANLVDAMQYFLNTDDRERNAMGHKKSDQYSHRCDIWNIYPHC